MRVLIFSDVQATDGHERCFGNTTKSLQIWRVNKFLSKLKEIYAAYQCDALWDLGDLTDDRNAIPVPVIDSLCDGFEPFDGEWNIKLVGNHEQWLRSSDIHAGKMFRRFFQVVDTLQTVKIGKVNICCISYHDDLESTVDFLRNERRNQVPTIVLGHFQVASCQMYSGKALTGVPRDILAFSRISLLGHIHKPQSMDHVHYVRSPFQQHWGEAGEDKRVAILDFDSDTGDFKLYWVPMDGFPRYLKVNFEDFSSLVKEASEDRYKVVLRSIEEAEAYYAHPLSNRADEVIYDFDQKSDPDAPETVPCARSDVLARYVALNPPKNFGIELDDKTLLEFGEEIVSEL